MAHTSPDGHDSTTVNDCASRIDEQFDPLGTYTQDVTWSEMKVGTLEFPTYRISTDGDWGGLEIEGGFKLDEGRSINDAPCCCDEVRWIQLISTNKLPGAAVTPGVDHYLDPLNDRDPAKDPFYWGTEDYRDRTNNVVPGFKVTSWQDRDGYSLKFYDRPQRFRLTTNPHINWPTASGDLVWTAQLALACVKHNDTGGGLINYLASVRYGFRISRENGTVTLAPVSIKTHGISQIFTTTVGSFGNGWKEGHVVGEYCDDK